MNLDVRSESASLESALRTYIARRLHFALGRFAGRLGRVRVRVEDVAGAGDLTDASCHIQAELVPSGRILRQEAVDRNLYIAINLATERIGRSFGRELDRARTRGIASEAAGPPGLLRAKRMK